MTCTPDVNITGVPGRCESHFGDLVESFSSLSTERPRKRRVVRRLSNGSMIGITSPALLLSGTE